MKQAIWETYDRKTEEKQYQNVRNNIGCHTFMTSNVKLSLVCDMSLITMQCADLKSSDESRESADIIL